MQLTNVLGLCLLAMTANAAVLPRFAGPYHGGQISVQVPSNSTTPHNATTTGTKGKVPLTTGTPKPRKGSNSKGNSKKPQASHGVQNVDIPLNSNIPNHVKHINHCHELCSLEAQTCNIAMPDEDKTCDETYKQCSSKCHPSDFE